MKLQVIGLALLFSGAVPAFSRTIVVDPSGAGDFTGIQPAIDAAVDGDEVLVKPAEYVITEPIDFNRLHDPEDPASPPVKNIAVRSEAGAGETRIRMAEEPADVDRACVVVFKSGETRTSVLEGFTLTGGTGATWVDWRERDGGGLLCIEGSSPTVVACTLSGNSAKYYGGGVNCRDASSPTFTNCTIRGNSAISGGSGVYCRDASSPTFTNCTVSGNAGGGVCCWADSSPTLMNCAIFGNAGRGVLCGWNTSPVLTNCTISGNAGCGVLCGPNSSATLTSTIVWRNVGGALAALGDDSWFDVRFCCIEGGEVWRGEGNINDDPLFCGFSGPPDVFVDPASPEGGDGTAGRPFRDLAAALEYSLSLRANSPCIGAGKDGGNMGADLDTCERGGPSERVAHLAPGRYRIDGLTLAQGASILGEDPGDTVIEGTVWGLRTGATLSRVTVTAGTSGGIVVDRGESPRIEECTISGNSAVVGGGVCCREGSSPTLTDCTITGNSAGDGGGVYLAGDFSTTLASCTISGNSAVVGGGVCCREGSSPTLTDCTITGNSARSDGGGVYCSIDSMPALRNCTLSGNSAESGGGVYCQDLSSPAVTHCTISGNSADEGGGVYCVAGSWPILTSCTITGNSALDAGGVYCRDGSSPTLTSTIVWGNSGGALFVAGGSPQLDVSSCCIESGMRWPGEGNINSDPLFCGFSGPRDVFVDPESPEGGEGTAERPFRDLAAALEYSLSLRANSPCIGAGKDGGNMGAHPVACGPGAPGGRVVHLAPGRYRMEGLPLAHGATILGEDADDTVLEGTVRGLRTGAALSRVTVTGGQDGAIVVDRGESPGIEECTIRGNSAKHSGGGVYCGENSSPTLTHCTISGNSAIGGGGISCGQNSSPFLASCTISGNSAADHGGGVYCGLGSLPTLVSCTISRNSAIRGGGMYCTLNSLPALESCTISGNSADDYAGGVYCSGNVSLVLAHCTISGNSARKGGGLCCCSCSPRLTSTIVWGNTGGSLFASGEDSRPQVSFSCIQGGEIWPGEGNINDDPLFCGFSGPPDVFVDPASPEGGDGTAERPFRDLAAALEYSSSLRANSPCIGAGKDGGNMGADLDTCGPGWTSERVAHLAPGRYRIEGLTLAQGASIRGDDPGNTVIEGTVWGLRTGATLSRVTVTAGTSGGIVVDRGESPRIEECTISRNWTEDNGGGVSCGEASSPTLTHCTISGNSATYGKAGGVFCQDNSSPALTNCTVSGNWAAYGGGVYCLRSSPVLTNCTLSGNLANCAGGVFCQDNSSPTFTNCTVSGNSTLYGGDLVCAVDSSPVLTNCIFQGSAPDVVCGVLSHCLTDVDPLFVSGGFFDFTRFITVEMAGEERRFPDFTVQAPDYRLQPGSPAIDAGTAEKAPPFDIEGLFRPCGAAVDIGAHEFRTPDCGLRVEFRRGDANADGERNLTDAVFTLRYLFQGGDAPPCLKAADSDDQDGLNLTDAVYLLNFLFLGGDAIPEPFHDCALDPTVDDLTCERFAACEP